MAVSRREYFLQLVDTRTKRPIDDDTGQFQVYTAGSPARATIYDVANTALTQAVAGGAFVSRTMTNGQIHVFTDISVSSVDLSVLTAGGRAYFLKGITASQHRVDVDPEQHSFTLIAAINDAASSTASRSTGFTARKGMIINDVFVKVAATFVGAATGNNLYNFGIAGDSNAFAVNMNLTATGYKQILVHSSTGKIFATQFAGAELASWQTGSTIATNAGWFTRKRYFTPAATALHFARAVALTASFTGTKAGTGKAYVFYAYELDPTANAAL